MKTPTSRAKALASAAVAAGLCLAGTTAVSSPSQAATGTCDTAAPVSGLSAGELVHGLTVSTGTTPDPFTGSVLGVLTDGIEPGVDMVMVQLTSTAIDNAGIWEGMSGSPVYDASDHLIGAVAYTLSFGKTSVAGVTPWADMEQYAGGPAPLHVAIPASAARSIARQTSVSTAQASQGFQELRTPQVVSGLSPRVLARDTGRPYLSNDVSVAGRTSSGSSPTVADMIAGGNLVATLSTGDVTQGGVGTITSVCDGRVVGFGHPMQFIGKTTYGMAGADALFIQTDPTGPSFKVANLGDTLGTIDQDRQTGISGPLGTIPTSIPVTSTVTYHPAGGAVRTRTGHSAVQLPIAAAGTANYELILNHQAVLDAYQPGSENQSWTITGHTASGPFTFTGGNRYADPNDIAFASVWDMPDLVWLLSNVSGVTIDSITDHASVVDDTSTWRISGAEQWRGGQWVPVGSGHPAVVKAGTTLKMRVLLSGPGGATSSKKFSVPVPAGAAGSRGNVFLSSAQPFPFEQSMPSTLSGVRKLADHMVRNDQVQASFFAFTKSHQVQAHTTTNPAGKVITGQKGFRVNVQ